MLAQTKEYKMIKVAVMSDLHGNIEALKAVFADVDALGIKRILILGDLALMGPEPNKAIDFVKDVIEKYDVDIIQGNTDLMIINDELPNVADFVKNAILYSKENVTTENKAFLRSLTPQKSIKIGETSILMVHGSPRRIDENIMPARPIEEIKPMLADAKEALILCGHTHKPAGYQIEKQTIVNDGSVGRPMNGDYRSCYVVLDIDEEKQNCFSVEHRFVEYDFETAAAKLGAQNFEGAKILEGMLLNPQG